MAGKRDGGFFLDDPASRLLLLALVGLIWFQGESLRSEIRDLRTELRAEIGELHREVGDLSKRVAKLEVAVARIEARRSLQLMLALRFAASGEGASVGGPTIAAGLLLARARPEIDSILSAIDQDARSELANDLWEDRANILARAAPVL